MRPRPINLLTNLAHLALAAVIICAAPPLQADELPLPPSDLPLSDLLPQDLLTPDPPLPGLPSPDLGGPNDDMQRLKGNALWDAISGTTLLGIYRGKRPSSGTPHFTEYHDPDGTTQYREGGVSGPGRWAIIQDRLCFAYKDILTPGPHCFVIIQSGNCLFNYRSIIIENDLPTHPDLWSSKAVPKGQVSTCDTPIG